MATRTRKKPADVDGEDEKDFNKKQGVDITKPHLVVEMMTQAEWYPAHPPRKNSNLYNQTHKEMIFKRNTPCDVCNVTHQDIVDGGKSVVTEHNPHGAMDLETHHFIIEWAESAGVDWDKVAKAYPDIKSLQHIAHAWDIEHFSGKHLHTGTKFADGTKHEDYKHTCKVHGTKCKLAGNTKKTHVKYQDVDATEFIDGVDQMKVLCNIHHRSPFFGIHKITFPIWQMQKFMRDDFQLLPDSIGNDVKKRTKKKA